MNNIQKSFKSKARCGLRMAVGGVIADPTDQQRTPDSDLDRLTAQSNMSAAMAGLSNTERYQLANPTNAPYKANSMMGGTSAEASMLRQRSGILASLRDRLAEQQQPTLPSLRFADGGIINTLRNRGAVIDAAVDSAANADSQPVARPAAVPVAAALPSQASDYAAQAAALEAEQLAAARAAAAPKPKQGLMSRLGFANGGVVQPNMYLGEQIRASRPPNLLNAAGEVVDSLPYAAAQFVPGLNVPLGGAAMAVHTAQGRTGELPLDAAAMIPGGKGVLLAKGAKLAAKRAAGGLGRAANSVQALGAADAFGAPAYAQGGVVRLQGPGTGTSDDIPLTLNTGGEGMNINVSNGEGLAVLPAKTMQHPEAVEAVNDIIETTNGKPPRGLKAGASYADGVLDKVRSTVADAADYVAGKARPAGAAPAPEVTVGEATPEEFARAQNAAERARINTAANGASAAPVEAPSTPISAKTQAALRANMADQSLYGRTVEAVGNAKQSLERGAARVAASPYARELGRAATIVSAAGPAIENSLGENRIKPVGERTFMKDLAAGVFNSYDTGAKFVDNMASPITHGLNYAVKTFGGPENYFNDRAFSNAYRRAITESYAGEFTAPTTQNGEKVKIAGASSAPAQPAAVEPGAQERTFSAGKPGAAVAADTDRANNIQRRSIRTPDGRTQPEFYGTNVKQTYTGADGKPTTNWYDTQDYKDSQVRAQKDRALLKQYEQWGIEGDLKSTNPVYQARGLTRQKAFDENAKTELARSQLEADRAYKQGDLEMRREDLGLRRAQEARALASAQRQTQRDAVEMDLKTREAMDKDEEQVRKIYAGHFLTKNDKGEMIEDKAALDDFLRRANHSILAEGRATKDARLWDANTNRPKSFANMDKATQDFILNRYNAYRRWKQAQGVLPGYADKGDTMNLFDLNAQEDGDYLVFPRLGKARAQKKDFMYTSPVGALELAAMKTPEDTLYRNLLGK